MSKDRHSKVLQKLVYVFLFVGYFLVNYAWAGEGLSQSQVRDLIQQAESVYGQAKAENNSWVVTRRLIEQARAQFSAGNLASAEATAIRALLTAQESLNQLIREKESWQQRVPG